MAIGLKDRLRYRFDNLMARGTGAQIGLLALSAAALVLLTGAILVILGLSPADDQGHRASLGELLWEGLMRTLDAGNLAGDVGWGLRVVMLVTTIGGIFVMASLIGVLTGGFGQMIENLRKGRSQVVERDHLVILGWSQKIGPILAELAEANENRPNAALAILSDRDKVEMDDEIKELMGDRHLRVVTRSGSPLSVGDLEIVNVREARAIIVLAPEIADAADHGVNESDTVVLKTLLAVAKATGEGGAGPHVVAELHDERTLDVARMVMGERAALVHTPPLISRLLVQTGRQSGLSVVHTELLDFGGDEIYMQSEPRLAGKPFREVVFAYEDSTVLGVISGRGEILLPPPFDRAMAADDQVIAVSRDDDTVVPNGRGPKFDEAALAAARPHATPRPERTLVLGASPRLALVLHELDAYVAPGSTTIVVGEDGRAAAGGVEGFKNMRAEYRDGDATDRRVLDALEVTGFDHVLVLSESGGRTQELADARTIITLLHLRDIMHKAGKAVAVTSEILDAESRELAAVAEADDFIVSNALVSLVMSQLAENRRLQRVLDDLLAAEGYEIYLKPAGDYVKADVDVDFYTVLEAAVRRKEVAIGYRLASQAKNGEQHYGVRLNPKKSERFRLGAQDKVIVLAESMA